MVSAAAAHKLYGWYLEAGEVNYQLALEWQRGLVKMRREGLARDTIVFLQHPPVVTVGRDGHQENFEGLKLTPIFVERGGDVTYHGPGQLVVYFIFNLSRRGRDLHSFMDLVQQGIIATLADYGITARRDSENTGVWVGEKKLASIGIAVKHWISSHGAAINLNTDLEDFRQISPCGLDPAVMTSTEQLLGKKLDMGEFSQALLRHYAEIFSTTFTPVLLEELAEEIESQGGGNVI
jgi:lipoate-protein ligase B